jgi:ribose-phosphate pyrophosphokinase
VDNRRSPNVADKSDIANFIGDVKGKTAILLDDVVTTSGSLCNAAVSVMEHGAKEVYACVTHPVLSGDAMEKVTASPLKKLFVLDTIEVPPEKMRDKLQILSVGPIFANTIDRIHNHKSIGNLFKMDFRYSQIPINE